MTDKPAEYALANHPDEDPEFMEALALTSRDTDQSPRGQLARAIAAFPALHRSWSLEALESLRGSYSLADYLLANCTASAPAEEGSGDA
jgi:hypothetical protein